MTGSCICGAVTVSVTKKPDFIHDCNCNLCRKSGAAWGYYSTSEVAAAGDTSIFMRKDKPGAVVHVHSCVVCGATTHFDLSEAFRADNPSVDQVGVNMKLFSPLDLNDVEVRYPDGMNWSGEGAFGYRRSAVMIGDTVPI
jgi:hypothetical protein